MKKVRVPSVIFLDKGESLQLNFQTYSFPEKTAIFIPQGHYLQCSSKDQALELEQIDASSYRYLFSQLVSLGHIHADEKPTHLNDGYLDHARSIWLQMNPFDASLDELEILFNLNDWLEENVQASLPLESIPSARDYQNIIRNKLDLTFFQWKNLKLVLHAKRKLWESGGLIKETTQELGFKDPSYFARFFKQKTNRTPAEFLASLEWHPFQYHLAEEFYDLINKHFTRHHAVSFYARKMNMTDKTLSRNIKQVTGASVKEHITKKLVQEAKNRLNEHESVTETAFALGFEEVSHFSAFMKIHSGSTPTDWKKMYQ